MSFRWMTTGGALLGMLFLAGCGSDKELVLYRPGDVPVWRTVENSPPLRRPVAPRTPPATASTPEITPDASTPAGDEPSESMANYPQVTLKTSQGDITIALYEDKAPITVANFLQYVDSDHYDGLIFHRVIPGFMIQGGGMDASMGEKPTMAPIKNEAKNSVPNKRGTLAMARTNVLDSATSQFFINLVDNNFLNGNGVTGGYAVFGEVVSGMDVVDAIGRTATGRKGYHSDVPVTPIVIQDVVRVEAK